MTLEKINEILDNEINFAKGCNMPQFVLGLQQAKKVLNDYKPQNEYVATEEGDYDVIGPNDIAP